MAHKKPCAKYQYVVTPSGPKILPVDEPSCKDEESPADYNAGGYLPIKLNDTFKSNRYRVVRKLGWGHFSTVWLVKDALTQRHSALKVIKSAGRYAETARDEIQLLSRVQSFSPDHPGRSHIVSFLDSFTHQAPESTHICILFEPLGENLLALIERHKKKGVPRTFVRVIARQILLGLEYLHEECDLVHTDIKPENILICIPDIEDHIQCELSRSPSPTSRRVGVPLPTKTRAGVSIPQLQQRPRRQVQIFDSQPLASPSRSLGRSGYSNFSLSTLPNGATGRNSTSGSYGSPMQLSGCSTISSNSNANIISSIPKVPSCLSTSVINGVSDTRESETERGDDGKISQLPQAKADNDSPPASSSSSSSIVSMEMGTSAMVVGSSNITTPPTSLPQSLTSSGLTSLLTCGDMDSYRASLHEHCPRNPQLHKVRQLPNFVDPKGKTRVGSEYNVASSPCHTNPNGCITSKVKSSVSPCPKKAAADDSHRYGHSPSHSCTSGFWKDPGASAPAPAVVVSAVVGAAGADGDCLELSNTSVQEVIKGPEGDGDVVSENPSVKSSMTPIKAKPPSLLHGVHKIITTNLFLHDQTSSIAGKYGHKTHISGPSLLTRTAPPRQCLPQDGCGQLDASRPSSLKQMSYLPAHMHKYRSPSCKCTDPEHKHRAMLDGHRKDGKSQAQQGSKDDGQRPAVRNPAGKLNAADSSTSVTPTPALPPPVPPTTPCEDARFGHGALNAGTVETVPECADYEQNGEPTILSAVPSPPISTKIADLGNATPSTKHYTEDIQTRQYRAPEAILGRSDWDARVDMWSVACLVFELLTAEYLFDPQGQGELFSKDDDHMAQIIELMGDFSMEVKMGGKYSRELFDHTGGLRYIRTLKFWPLKRVMIEKYLYTEEESAALCEFLEPMLAVDMRQRAYARDVKNHKWLEPCDSDESVAEW